MAYLEHFAYVCDNTKESVIECLSELALRDNDFNGENGTKYLWEEAKGDDKLFVSLAYLTKY